MIIDKRTEFGSAVSLNTGAAGTYNIGDVIDLQGQAIGAANLTRDPFAGDDALYFIVQVQTTATSGGAATADFRLVSDNTSTIATDGSASLHTMSGPLAVASLTAGKTVFAGSLPAGQYERYLGVQQVTGTAAFTAGKVNVFLTADPALFRAYADNVG
jgi:hypothetical protein